MSTTGGSRQMNGNSRANREKRRVPPHAQPLRPAIALVTVVLVITALTAISYLVLPLLAGPIEQQMLSGDPRAMITVLALVGVVFALAVLGLGLASFILSIVVVVKGDGKLRLGAGLMLIASLCAFVISFSISGDSSQFSDTTVAVSSAFSVLDVVVDVVQLLLRVAGVVILILGILEVRRERAQLMSD